MADRRPRPRPSRPVLMVMALCLMAGGVLNAGAAWQSANANDSPPASDAAAGDGMALLQALKTREDAVAAREAEATRREAEIAAGAEKISQQLREMTEAETRLSQLVKHVDEAAAKDVDKLTSVYAAMKPKDAAALFNEMPPDFAAGFIAQMGADQAAAIMSAVDPKVGYSISVLLAGRNADLRSKAEGG